MLAQIADLRFCTFMPLHPLVPGPYVPGPFCLRTFVCTLMSDFVNFVRNLIET